ncbi:MAG: hypothetical protein FWD16_02920 [Clostridia bacterium]|nr:hypothetical protein [Clostridia bacterium]
MKRFYKVFMERYFPTLRTAALAFLATAAASSYFISEYNDVENAMFSFLLLLLFCMLSFKRPAEGRARNAVYKPAALGAFLGAAALVIGTSLYRTDSFDMIISRYGFSLHAIVMFAGGFWGLFLLLERLLCWFNGLGAAPKDRADSPWFTGNARSLLVVWGVIFLAWVPCLLGYFPGMFSYDSPHQFYCMSHGIYIDYHSIPHLYFLKLCFKIAGGDYQRVMLVHSLLQMAMMSFAYSFTVYYLAKLRARW